MVEVNSHQTTNHYTFWRNRAVTCQEHQCWVWGGERYVSLTAVIMSGNIISRRVLQRNSSESIYEVVRGQCACSVRILNFVACIWNLSHGNISGADWINRPTSQLWLNDRTFFFSFFFFLVLYPIMSLYRHPSFMLWTRKGSFAFVHVQPSISNKNQ